MGRRRPRITSGDGRRATAEDVREDSGDEPDEPEGEPEDSGTSLDDLTSEADPATFDRTFLSTDADLRVQGRYDPVAGPKQVLPRVAYVLSYQLVYNPDRDRWEADTGNGTEEPAEEVSPINVTSQINVAVNGTGSTASVSSSFSVST